MNVSEFADAQKSHYTVFPQLKKLKTDTRTIPFVKLLDGKEPSDRVEKRWELYHQLHSHFHAQVNDILENIGIDLRTEISELLFNRVDKNEKRKPAFNTLFLLGSDSTTRIDVPKVTPEEFSTLVELTPKESPNVRMMLRRSMFKLFSAAEAELRDNVARIKDEDEEHIELDAIYEADEVDADNESASGAENASGGGDVSYDLSLVQNFKLFYNKDLNLVFNFKDVDSINFQVLDNFIILLKSALKHQHVQISLVFNINTNLSNFEKNLTQTTMRLLRRSYHTLDVSSNKGYKYGNRIFQSFLDTVDGKLNLSSKFVDFILRKMANNSNHNLQLLTKILDYALMSYFYQNPFSVFIDPVNVEYLNDDYLDMLIRCPTFMFFIEGLIKEGAPTEEIRALITNKDATLTGFFLEFLVRENPINGFAKHVANFLEKKLQIYNYNLIAIYHKLLEGKLETYLERWPAYQKYKEDLRFEPVDTIFQELFTLDNSNGLLSQAIFPRYRSNMEDDLLSWERVLRVSSEKTGADPAARLDAAMSPIAGHLFKLYREAGLSINVYDFYTTFKETLPRNEIRNFLQQLNDTRMEKFLKKNSEEEAFDKVSLALFMQALFDFDHIGIIKTQSNKNHDIIEKCIWRGI
ncbi:hypothetical protein HG536_0E04260 [Torulaspora globosa]|uniref:Uncharacterized protein n=1 Tax=Torulaspora globosa TaxID=48254 RepID=A0A7G3ZJ29_9SACH|nr:uncharacterized protein HG536_0E04260 [Torulaspora globosa]QLL33515.1 hypothetical protein HG536_0E04260 [Torulaspora globosa]